jgi:hypothetical protein
MQEIVVRLQPDAVEIVGIHIESGTNECKTLTSSKKYFLPRPMNEKALVAQFSSSNILTLAAPWV